MIQHFIEELPPHVHGYVISDGADTAVIVNRSWLAGQIGRDDPLDGIEEVRRVSNDLLRACAGKYPTVARAG